MRRLPAELRHLEDCHLLDGATLDVLRHGYVVVHRDKIIAEEREGREALSFLLGALSGADVLDPLAGNLIDGATSFQWAGALSETWPPARGFSTPDDQAPSTRGSVVARLALSERVRLQTGARGEWPPDDVQPAQVPRRGVPGGWRQVTPGDVPVTDADVKRSRPKRALPSP